MDMQRRVLGKTSLTVHDLARLASQSKVFEEALRERYEVDREWLAGAALAMFGGRAIETVLDIMTTDRSECGCSPARRYYDICEGGSWPDKEELMSAHFVQLRAPARGLYMYSPFGGKHEPVVKWTFRFHPGAYPVITLEVDSHPSPLFHFNGISTAVIRPAAPDVTQAVALLGVVLLACQPVAEPEGRAQRKPTLNFQHPRTRGAPVVLQETSWSDPGTGPPDARRALSAMRMCIHRCSCKLSYFQLTWYALLSSTLR